MIERMPILLNDGARVHLSSLVLPRGDLAHLLGLYEIRTSCSTGDSHVRLAE